METAAILFVFLVLALVCSIARRKLPRRVKDVIRVALAAGVALGAVSLLGVSYARPVILFGLDDSKLILLQPLHQVQPTRFDTGSIWDCIGFANFEEYCYFNWGDPDLYVDGCCFCGDPSASDGTFIVALLPHGLATTRGENGHMSQPTYHIRWILLFPAFVVAGAIAVHPFRRWRRHKIGLCPTCGYDLRATPERCPECGRAVSVNEAAAAGDLKPEAR